MKFTGLGAEILYTISLPILLQNACVGSWAPGCRTERLKLKQWGLQSAHNFWTGSVLQNACVGPRATACRIDCLEFFNSVGCAPHTLSLLNLYYRMHDLSQGRPEAGSSASNSNTGGCTRHAFSTESVIQNACFGPWAPGSRIDHLNLSS